MFGYEVKCPYCEHVNDVSDALQELDSDNMTDWECENCEREFELQAEFEPSWSASKIVYAECENCGDVSRDFKQRGQLYPYPEMYKVDVLCEPCWRNGVLAELKD
ncbi:hypothetical protein [Metasolibacillus meyeri]|uniref:hypothetical protein n=1 Tax=Metasolibacillus meyeri TaxID=1071052 RepID=UPI000D2FBC84|nr:hypothetical protein [Metasolibacillus meyeri]